MREYRGKRKDNGEWVYGWYVRDDFVDKDNAALHYIIPESACFKIYRPINWNRVIPETVGQQTGLADQNGKEIYEGDILKGGDITSEVKWGNGARFDGINWWHYNNRELRIIGNIHDNPKLLK